MQQINFPERFKTGVYKKTFLVILVLLFFVIGFYFGKSSDNTNIFSSYQLRQKGNFKFINPLIECDLYSEGNFLRSKKLEETIIKKTKELTQNPLIEHISVYYRDLNNGPWLGINESEKFTPASLLKVPIMIAFFKKEDSSPSFLQKEVYYNGSLTSPIDQNIIPGEKIMKDKKYSLEEIIKIMIQYSDNDAANLLLANIDLDFLNKVYSDLMIPIPGSSEKNLENFMTVKEYASFFRILFNGSYLSKESSEKALAILANSSFKDGLVAGIPTDIVISHKFGERKINNSVQLHDCGIIYKPENPYLLCVMTRGSDFKKLTNTIAEISKTVWQESI